MRNRDFTGHRQRTWIGWRPVFTYIGPLPLRAGDYGRAYSRFEESFRHDVIDDRDNLILFLLRALNKVDAGSQQAITLRAGLSRLMAGI